MLSVLITLFPLAKSIGDLTMLLATPLWLFHIIKKMTLSKLIVLLLFVICSFRVDAQLKLTIKGVVLNDKEAVIPFANVSLLNAKDSSLLMQVVAGENGKYEIVSSSQGDFILKYESMGYKPGFSSSFILKERQSYEASPVQLKRVSYNLDNVTVISSKKSIQVTAGKMVFNVQNSINSTGSNALELLQKTPGIQLDNNDHITYKGKAGLQIYIDGRMTRLSNDDLALYLKSINSSDIDAIEIINNPGAEYDASGNAGVINIKLKKNKNFGTNGNFTIGLSEGKTPKGNDAVSVNYRNSKINIFSNAGINYGRSETDIHAQRIQKDTTYDQRLKILSTPINYNIKAGADYFINSRQIIGAMITSNFSTEDYRSSSNTGISYKPTNSYIKNLVATNNIPRKRDNADFNLNYKYSDTSGREVNFDADYGFYRNRAQSQQNNYYMDKNENLLSQVLTLNNTPTNIDIYTARLDVSLPLKMGSIAYGAKVSYVKTDNTFDLFNIISGNAVIAADNSYNFIYCENVNAVYLNYKRKFSPKLTMLAGFRTEQTHSDGMLTRTDGINQPDSRIIRNYLDFFPNAALTWSVNADNTFNIFYNRRIDRPSYQDLNPFEIKLDELSYVKGNPFLRPQYTNNFEVVYTWKTKINTSIEFSHVKDYATQTTDTLNNYTYVQQKNLATQNIATASIGSPITFRKWWQGYVNLWFNYQAFKGQVKDNYLDRKMAGYGAFIQQTFSLGNGYTADLNGWFKGPSALTPTFLAKAQGAVNIGLQKNLFGKRATLKLIATDIFRTSTPLKAKSDFGGLQINLSVLRESQTARISFTYSLGSSKIKESRKRQTASETEMKRVKEN